MAQIAWLGKKSPFCGNVSYGLSTTEAVARTQGHQTHFIHFDNPRSPESGTTSLLANDPDVSLPYLVKSQVYTIPSPGAQRELRESLERIRPDIVHASLTLSPLDFRLPELCQQLKVPLVATFHPPFDAGCAISRPGPSNSLTSSMPHSGSLRPGDCVLPAAGRCPGAPRRAGDRLAVIPNGVDQRRCWAPTTGTDTTVEPSAGAATAGQSTRVPLHGTHRHREKCRGPASGLAPGVTPGLPTGDRRRRPSALHPPEQLQRRGCALVGHEPDLATRMALLQCAEVFVLPSLVEGLSLALLEAMASGTACMATDAGADGEVLAGGAGIVLSTQGVTTQLRTLLPVLRDQPVLTAELGRRARQRALERYTIEPQHRRH